MERSKSEGSAEAAMEGHDHAAMTAGSGTLSPVVLDPEGARRIGVTFATVERRALPAGVRTVGTVAYDETRLATVNPKIVGWVEWLNIDFTGAPIKAVTTPTTAKGSKISAPIAARRRFRAPILISTGGRSIRSGFLPTFAA